jgi:hypothetical protein
MVAEKPCIPAVSTVVHALFISRHSYRLHLRSVLRHCEQINRLLRRSTVNHEAKPIGEQRPYPLAQPVVTFPEPLVCHIPGIGRKTGDELIARRFRGNVEALGRNPSRSARELKILKRICESDQVTQGPVFHSQVAVVRRRKSGPYRIGTRWLYGKRPQMRADCRCFDPTRSPKKLSEEKRAA